MSPRTIILVKEKEKRSPVKTWSAVLLGAAVGLCIGIAGMRSAQDQEYSKALSSRSIAGISSFSAQ